MPELSVQWLSNETISCVNSMWKFGNFDTTQTKHEINFKVLKLSFETNWLVLRIDFGDFRQFFRGDISKNQNSGTNICEMTVSDIFWSISEGQMKWKVDIFGIKQTL